MTWTASCATGVDPGGEGPTLGGMSEQTNVPHRLADGRLWVEVPVRGPDGIQTGEWAAIGPENPLWAEWDRWLTEREAGR